MHPAPRMLLTGPQAPQGGCYGPQPSRAASGAGPRGVQGREAPSGGEKLPAGARRSSWLETRSFLIASPHRPWHPQLPALDQGPSTFDPLHPPSPAEPFPLQVSAVDQPPGITDLDAHSRLLERLAGEVSRLSFQASRGKVRCAPLLLSPPPNPSLAPPMPPPARALPPPLHCITQPLDQPPTPRLLLTPPPLPMLLSLK